MPTRTGEPIAALGCSIRQANSTGVIAMNEHTAIIEPTSIATTSQTEPGVVAGISSAEGSPDQALSIRVPGDIGIGRMLVMLSAGIALGYGAYRLWQARGSIF